MSFFNRAFTKTFVAVVLVALSLFVFNYASSAYANTLPSQMRAHSSHVQPVYMSSLPNCLTTFYPNARNPLDRVCLTPVPASEAKSASPSDTFGPCNFAYYQNGPYLPSSGWSACALVLSGNDYFVPRSLNDQASSWASCGTGGVFYANQPGTSPSASFPANSHGNFPWGAVPNDSLSSAFVNNINATCNLPIA